MLAKIEIMLNRGLIYCAIKYDFSRNTYKYVQVFQLFIIDKNTQYKYLKSLNKDYQVFSKKSVSDNCDFDNSTLYFSPYCL